MTVDELAVAKVKCDKSLLFFTRFFFKNITGQKFIVNWHHEEIARELEAVEKYETLFLNINIPPRNSKTELAGVNFIARSLGKNPNANFLYITASDDLRAETSIKIRDIVTHELFYKLYGIKLKKDQNAKNLWRTEQGGGLKTATILGQITGFGAGQMIEHNQDLEDYIRDFEGCIVLDDIDKIDDTVINNAKSKKVIRTLFNTVFSRKNSEDTPIINIQQRISQNDSTAYLLEHFKNNKKVKSLVFPVIIDGKPLWEWKMGMDSIKELKNGSETKYTFESQYMQNPQPLKGLLFNKSELQYFKELNKETLANANIIAAIDPADGGTDFYCMVFGAIINNKCYIFDIIFLNEKLTTCEGVTVAKSNENKLMNCILETNKEGSIYIRDLGEKLPSVTLYPKKQTANKHTRILANAGFIIDNFVFLDESLQSDEYKRYFSNLTTYMLTGAQEENDDAPDCTALLARFIRNMYFIQ